MALYEQVVIELLEIREQSLAKELLRTIEPLKQLKIDQPARYSKLDALCHRPTFSAAEAYEMGLTREKKRKEVADMLKEEITSAPPGRLLALLGQALQYQVILV